MVPPSHNELLAPDSADIPSSSKPIDVPGDATFAGVAAGFTRLQPRLRDDVHAPEWIAPALAGSVALLAAIAILTAYLDPMPQSNHTYVPLAIVVVVVAWGCEIIGVPWSRYVFALVVTVPNVMLTALGHVGANYLFLMLMVAWVTWVGTHREELFGLGLALVAIGYAAYSQFSAGEGEFAVWLVWTVGMLTIWIAARMIGSQQILLSKLRRTQLLLDRKARETEALYQADAHLYESLHLDTVLKGLVDAVTQHLNADKCALMVWNPELERLVVAATSGFSRESVERMTYAPGEGIAGAVFLGGEPITVEDTSRDPRVRHDIGDPEGVRSVLSVPLFVSGEVFGVFGVNYLNQRAFTSADVALFQSLAHRAEMAIGNARLHGQAQRAATLEERQRLARELHDSATQSIYSARLYAEAAGRLMNQNDIETAREYLDEVKAATRDALIEMRLLIHELRPPVLEREGLVSALRQRLSAVEERAGITACLHYDSDLPERLPLVLEHVLFGVAHESLNNALRHGKPDEISVTIWQTAELLQLEVRDNGVGFDIEAATQGGGNGLRGMKERVARAGGRLEIHSAPAGGTCVRVEVLR